MIAYAFPGEDKRDKVSLEKTTCAQQVIPPDPRQRASHQSCCLRCGLRIIAARAGEFQR
jgi:hypothetical protein